MVYDIAKHLTYENVERWLRELRDHADQNYPHGQLDILYGKDLLKAQKYSNKVYKRVIRVNKRTAYTDFTNRIKNTEEMARFAKSTLNTGSRIDLNQGSNVYRLKRCGFL